MKTDQRSDVSLWYPQGHEVKFPGLGAALTTDVVIIGGGITGLTAALRLAEAGRKVTVLEARTIGSGVTGGTTAHLTEAVDTRFFQIQSDFGVDGAELVARGSRTAMTHIAERAAAIPCHHEVVPGFLYAEEAKDLDELAKEEKAAKRAGLNVELVRECGLPFATAGALKFAGQAQIHAGEYLNGLLRLCLAKGVTVHEQTRVAKLSDGEPCTLELENEVKVEAKEVFCATNDPITLLALQTKIAHYRSYAIAVPNTKVPKALFWDTMDPYHYLRLAQYEGKELLIVGGEDHKTGTTESDPEDSFDKLLAYSRERFGGVQVEFRWSAQIIEPVDGLPFIGRSSGSKHVFVATGFSGNGMTFGTLAAMVVSDLILGRSNIYESLFKATRIKPLASAVDYVKENVSFPTHLIGDRLAKPDVASVAEIKAGEGAIVDSKEGRLAVYRTPAGQLQACSAVCTHLGCLVKFNGAERTWDCPCHGSRFSVTREVIDGPATINLARHQLDEQSAVKK